MFKSAVKIILGFLFFTTGLLAQTNWYAEYFFDFDPGHGLATPVSTTPGDSVFSFSVNKAELAPGFHILYSRAKDGTGRWTHYVLKPFYIPAMELPDTTRSKIDYAEYFFDNDPGFGKGSGMPLGASVNSEAVFSINKSSLKPGFHILYIRARDEQNRWTLHMARPILISTTVEKTLTSVTALEYYFFRDGVASDTFRVADFEPGSNVEISFMPDFSTLLQDSTYDFHVFAIDSSGRRSIDFIFGDQPITTEIEEDVLIALLPETLELKANYPNPFNPSTTITFGLPHKQNVKMVIYDIIGRQVAELVDKQMEAGYHTIVWDGKNNNGARAASGFYIYRILTGNKALSRKMILLK